MNNADSYGQLCDFVRVVSQQSPVRHFVVHCRKALLSYSPADNRKVPPLRRAWAYALARDFPHLTFSLNGQASTDDCANCFCNCLISGQLYAWSWSIFDVHASSMFACATSQVRETTMGRLHRGRQFSKAGDCQFLST